MPNLGSLWLRVAASADADVRTSATVGSRDGISFVDLFDPAGIVISGVDAPGEDPGDEPDETDADGGTQH